MRVQQTAHAKMLCCADGGNGSEPLHTWQFDELLNRVVLAQLATPLDFLPVRLGIYWAHTLQKAACALLTLQTCCAANKCTAADSPSSWQQHVRRLDIPMTQQACRQGGGQPHVLPAVTEAGDKRQGSCHRGECPSCSTSRLNGRVAPGVLVAPQDADWHPDRCQLLLGQRAAAVGQEVEEHVRRPRLQSGLQNLLHLRGGSSARSQRLDFPSVQGRQHGGWVRTGWH